jgi:flagellar M-ring protein FliF
LNSPDETAEAAVATREFAYTRKLEESYQQRIIELLEPMVGPGRVRATVTADLDFTVTEETRENYDPQKTAVRSEQTANDTHKGADGAEGIPGALSNQPPGTAGAPATAQSGAQAAANGPSSNSTRSTKNYEVDRTLAYVKQPTGVLKRLNVGVVLDDWQRVDAKGATSTAPMSDNDIKRFTQLVRDSIGIESERGDQLNVLNQAFKVSAPLAPVEALPLWEQPWVKQAAKQVVGAALVLIVAFLVLRPLMKSLTWSAVKPGAATAVELAGDKLSLSDPGTKGIKLAPSFEQQLAAARSLVGQDPKRAAQVVKDWVAADG